MNYKMLWQFYITFWSTFIVSFFVIYGANLNYLKTITLSSVASSTTCVINIYFQNKNKKKEGSEKMEMPEVKNEENKTEDLFMSKNEVLRGLHSIYIDYIDDNYYREVLLNAMKIVEKEGDSNDNFKF